MQFFLSSFFYSFFLCKHIYNIPANCSANLANTAYVKTHRGPNIIGPNLVLPPFWSIRFPLYFIFSAYAFFSSLYFSLSLFFIKFAITDKGRIEGRGEGDKAYDATTKKRAATQCWQRIFFIILILLLYYFMQPSDRIEKQKKK